LIEAASLVFTILVFLQNVSLVNTVLATITANSFKAFADAIEKGAAPQDVAAKALNDSWKVIFNGNNYDPANQEMLTKRGVWRIDSGVDAICRYTDPKNTKLFEDMKVDSSSGFLDNC
jgi:glutamine synthetase